MFYIIYKDSKTFASKTALGGWAELYPGNGDSVGKIKNREITNGNDNFKRISEQFDWGITRAKRCWSDLKRENI